MSGLFLPRELIWSRVVLIYQMPKIGSQTIESTLRRYSFPHAIRRFHYLSPALVGTVRRGISSAKPDAAWKQQALEQVKATKEITRIIRLRRRLSGFGFRVPKLEVITGVRELIGQVLSSSFENDLYCSPTSEA